MSGVVHHLVSRGLDVTVSRYQNNDQDVRIKQIPTWGFVALWTTGLVYLAVMFAIRYSYGAVVATLTMIETPTATAFTVDIVESDETDAPLLSADQKAAEKGATVEPELFLVKSKPITSSIRATMKHLRTQAGPWSRFRGLQVAGVYHVVHHFIFRFFLGMTGHFPMAQPIMAVLTTLVLCRLQMTWTHVVVSAPSSAPWYRRIPSMKSGRNVLLATAVWAIAVQVAIYMPITLYNVFGIREFVENPEHFGEVGEEARKTVLKQLILVAAVGLATVVLVVFPANVSLKRVQASMLPEEVEAIVPFDRTFANKVKPEILGGSGAVSVLDAWRTFGWAARVRLVNLYAKVFAIQFAVSIMFAVSVFMELRLIMGDELNKIVDQTAALINRQS